MYLSAKKQTEVIARVNDRYRQWKTHWDTLYNGILKDYRRMANGELPQEIADKLKHNDYKYNSKLIPRVIPDAIQYMKAIASNSLFNRDMMFEFTGARKEDPQRAEDANDLVTDLFLRTDFRRTADQLIEDGLEVGIFFAERRHWRDIRPIVQYKREGLLGRKKLVRNAFETIFEGPRYYRLKPEMVSLDPDIKDPAMKPEHSKTMIMSISQIRQERDGLYKDFADNIKKIKPGDFDPAVLTEYDRQSDHLKSNTDNKKADEDFNVVYTENWYRFQNPETDIPVMTCIGIANYNTKPYILRYDIDPMQTGESNLTIGRIYPRNDRMIGECVPEKISDYMLEKFIARNSTIDIANLARDVTGLLFAPGDLIDTDAFVTRRKRIIKMRSGLPSEIKDIKLDTSVVQHMMAREAMADIDIEKSLATSRVSSGQTPSRRETATTMSIVNENSQIMSNYPLRQIEESLIKPIALGSLIHAQMLMPEEFKVRILGKDRSFSWKDMKRADILGVFDVRCYGSSEILTKGVKQALLDKFVQTWSGNPHVRIDWQGVAREGLKFSEIPSADRYVLDTSYDKVYAERENSLLMSGTDIHPIEEDNHAVHIQVHLPLKDLLNKALTKARQEGLGSETERIVQMLSMVELHLLGHQQFEQIINGQMNVGAGSQLPIMDNTQKLTRNLNSDMNPTVGGG